MRILTVGDGDFSFSLALLRAYGSTTITKLTATALIDREEVIETYSNSAAILQELEQQQQVQLLFGVDATQLHTYEFNNDNTNDEKCKVLGCSQYDLIVFNHPHLGYSSLSDEAFHARRHHILLCHYFFSCTEPRMVSEASILARDGIVHVNLGSTQSEVWKVKEAATERRNKNRLSRFQIMSTSLPFHSCLQQQLSSSSSVSNSCCSSSDWIPNDTKSEWKAPRKYRNGKLGSVHWLGKYGYTHKRSFGDHDMNVESSVNITFKQQINESNEEEGGKISNGNSCVCSICGCELNNLKEFLNHQKSPVPPDIRKVWVDESSGKLFSSDYALKTYQRQLFLEESIKAVHASNSVERVVSTNNDVVENPMDSPVKQQLLSVSQSKSSFKGKRQGQILKVQQEGRRLRWWARQAETFGSVLKTKKICDSAIKDGRLLVNNVPAYDSSRILKFGDEVMLLSYEVGTNDYGKLQIKPVSIIYQSGDCFLVVFKEAGMRACGKFNGTLENLLSLQVNPKPNSNLQALTQLESGCPGLCVFCRDPTFDTRSHEFVFTFYALVYGKKSSQILEQQPLPQDKSKFWGKKAATTDEEVLSLKRKLDVDTFEKHGESSIDQQPWYSQTAWLLSLEVLEEQRCITDEANNEEEEKLLMTLQIKAKGRRGRLSGSICNFLRSSKNCPVVGDRFARNFKEIPRNLRGRMKDKLHIGCYGISLSGPDQQFVTSTSPPDRYYVNYHCQNIGR